ncbi:MAG: hypothetical protein OHK0012_17890 [Synechococcales cyanobacterium]
MAEYRRTEYRIGPDGTVTVVVLDGEGESCLLTTEASETALGTVVERQLQPEFSQMSAEQETSDTLQQSTTHSG